MVFLHPLLLKTEDEVYCGNEADTCYDVIPLDLHVESDNRERQKDYQSDYLLQDLQLHQREWSAVALKTDAVGGHLQAVFEKCNTPRDGNHANQGQGLKP